MRFRIFIFSQVPKQSSRERMWNSTVSHVLHVSTERMWHYCHPQPSWLSSSPAPPYVAGLGGGAYQSYQLADNLDSGGLTVFCRFCKFCKYFQCWVFLWLLFISYVLQLLCWAMSAPRRPAPLAIKSISFWLGRWERHYQVLFEIHACRLVEGVILALSLQKLWCKRQLDEPRDSFNNSFP